MNKKIGIFDYLACVLCPAGCELEVDQKADGELNISGYLCEKGIDFASEEILAPKRNVTTSVPMAGTDSVMVSVRLSGPVPRHLIFPVLKEIFRLRPQRPVKRGQVLIKDVLQSGVDVIATRTVD